MSVLILAEKQNNELHPSVDNALTAAKQLSDDITIVTASSVTDELIVLAEKYDRILGCARHIPQTVLATLSAKLDCPMVSRVKTVINQTTFERTTYAGRIIETVSVKADKLIITIDTNAFDPTALGDETITHFDSKPAFEKVGERLIDWTKPSLTTAKTIIGVGGGIGEPENMAIIEPLAQKLNAVFGSGRGAIDAGALKIDTLIGQSGKTVAPDLYIAIGISGASQHIAGIKDSKKIIAINKDPQAPIFQYADVGIVGDFKEVVPKLVALLN